MSSSRLPAASPRRAFSLAGTVVALLILGVLATLFLVMSRTSVTTETAKSVMVEDLRRLATSSALSTTEGGSVLGASGATFSRDVTPVLDVPLGDSRVVVVRHAKAKEVVCQVATGSLAGSPTCGTPEPTPTGSFSVMAERVLVNDAPRTALVYRLSPLFTAPWTAATGSGAGSETTESGAEAVAIQLPDGRVETFTKTQLSSLDYTATVVVDTTVGADDVLLYALNGSGRVRANGGALPGGGSGSASSNFTASALEVVAGQPISFSATGIQVGGQNATAWNWRFGDGTFSSSVSPSKTFVTPGTYTVTLQMANLSGMVSTPVMRTITVTAPAAPAQNQAPTAVLTANRVWAAPSQAVTFSATGSLDSDGTIVSYRFTSGGGASQTSTSPTFVASYRNAGTYTATLTVTDNSGATTSQSLVVTVSAAAAPLSASRSTAVLSSTSSVRQAPVTLTVTARDANGVALSNRAVTLTGTASLTFGATTGTTNASGVFTTSVSGSTVGAQAIGVSIAGTALTSPPTLQVILGAPTTLTVTGPSTTTSGATLAPISVQLRESGGLAVPVSGTTVTASVQSGGGTLGGTLTAVSDANGVATFSTLTLSGTLGGRVLRFSASGLTDATLSVDLQAGAATTLSGLGASGASSVVAGSSLTTDQRLRVALSDAAGNPVSGTTVTWSVLSGGGAFTGLTTSTTDAAGLAIMPAFTTAASVGTVTIRATAGALTRDQAITTVAGAASQLTLTTDVSATATAGTAFATQPIVQLRDASGNAVSQGGVVITASRTTGSATLAGTLTATTNASGVATFTDLRLDGATGSHTLTFSASGLSSATSQSLTLSAGAATALTLTTEPSATAAAGTAFATQPVVQLRDAFGNAVTQSGVVITASRATGSATLAGTLTATTNTSGVATFSGLRLEGATGSHALTFSASGLSPATSGTITLSAGTASTLTLTAQPSSTTASQAVLATQPVVQLRDAFGNAVSQSGVAVTASIETMPGGGEWLEGTVTVSTNASGVATFTNLALEGVVGTYSLRFAASGVTAVISNAITLTPGVARLIFIETFPPTTVTAGVAFSPQPVIRLRDDYDNFVPQAGVVITASRTVGTATLAGPSLTATTDAEGRATFTGLRFDGTAGSGNRIQFAGPGVGSNTTLLMTVNPGAASQLAITTQPGTTSAPLGVALSPQPVIQLRDAFGNAVSQSGVVVTASIASGTGTLGGTVTATTNASGVATFTNLQINTNAGSHTLAFAAPSLTGVTSDAFTVVLAVSATNSTFTSSATTITASTGTSTATLTVTVRNASNQTMGGVPVTISSTGTNNTITPVSGTTNASGVFTATFASTRAEGKTLTVVAGGVTLTQTRAVTVTPGAVTGMTTVGGAPFTITESSWSSGNLTLQLVDAFGNEIQQPNAQISLFFPASPSTNVGLNFGSGILFTGATGRVTISSIFVGTAAVVSGTYPFNVRVGGVVTSTTLSFPVITQRPTAPTITCSVPLGSTVTRGQEFTCTLSGSQLPGGGAVPSYQLQVGGAVVMASPSLSWTGSQFLGTVGSSPVRLMALSSGTFTVRGEAFNTSWQLGPATITPTFSVSPTGGAFPDYNPVNSGATCSAEGSGQALCVAPSAENPFAFVSGYTETSGFSFTRIRSGPLGTTPYLVPEAWNQNSTPGAISVWRQASAAGVTWFFDRFRQTDEFYFDDLWNITGSTSWVEPLLYDSQPSRTF